MNSDPPQVQPTALYRTAVGAVPTVPAEPADSTSATSEQVDRANHEFPATSGDETRAAVSTDGPLGHCVSNLHQTKLLMLVPVGLILFGAIIIAASILAPSDKLTAQEALYRGLVVGGALIGVGACAAIIVFVSRPRTFGIEVYHDRFEVVRTARTQVFPWAEVECLIVPQLSEPVRRTANFTAQARLFSGTRIRFRADFDGEPSAVLNAFLTHCDYIVQDPAGYTSVIPRSKRPVTNV